jgi:hypothetical protein
VSRAQAEQAPTTIAGELRRFRPHTDTRKVAVHLTSLHEHIVGDYASTLRLLLGAVLLVLLLVCVNLASLSLARYSARRLELAVRAALGVGRSRLAMQLPRSRRRDVRGGCHTGHRPRRRAALLTGFHPHAAVPGWRSVAAW